MIELPALAIVITTALVDSINPCAIGVLILLIATLLSLVHNKKRMLKVGLIYITTVFITYLLAGLGLLFFLQRFNLAKPLGIGVGGLVILLGILEIKDFFWYGQGISLRIPLKQANKIKKYVKKVTIPGAVFLGVFVAAVELPCTGGPYLAITTLLAQLGFSLKVFLYLVVYNFIFVLPLITIVLLAYFGTDIKSVHAWKQNKRKWMRLGVGIIMISLGVLLILFSIRIINLAIY